MRRRHYQTYRNKYKMTRSNMDKNFNQKVINSLLFFRALRKAVMITA